MVILYWWILLILQWQLGSSVWRWMASLSNNDTERKLSDSGWQHNVITHNWSCDKRNPSSRCFVKVHRCWTHGGQTHFFTAPLFRSRRPNLQESCVVRVLDDPLVLVFWRQSSVVLCKGHVMSVLMFGAAPRAVSDIFNTDWPDCQSICRFTVLSVIRMFSPRLIRMRGTILSKRCSKHLHSAVFICTSFFFRRSCDFPQLVLAWILSQHRNIESW